jgi:hypothetical protein
MADVDVDVERDDVATVSESAVAKSPKSPLSSSPLLLMLFSELLLLIKLACAKSLWTGVCCGTNTIEKADGVPAEGTTDAIKEGDPAPRGESDEEMNAGEGIEVSESGKPIPPMLVAGADAPDDDDDEENKTVPNPTSANAE